MGESYKTKAVRTRRNSGGYRLVEIRPRGLMVASRMLLAMAREVQKIEVKMPLLNRYHI